MMNVVPTRLGEAYQAKIPALLTAMERADEQKRGARPPCRSKWTPSTFSEDEVVEYLRCSRMNETEAALHCLFEGSFDVHKAAKLLHGDRQRRARQLRQELSAIGDKEFEDAVMTHGKRFSLIQQHFPESQTSDLIARFYQWKTTTTYKRWHERVKAKKNKEAARLRQWADTEESDTSDFHNEYCELCCTGGQLLCCDGCERAYHFSCVEPPIKDVPMGDWFCATCSAILSSSAEARVSKENEFCEEYVVTDRQLDDQDIDDPVDEKDDQDVGTDGNETEEVEDATIEVTYARPATPVKKKSSDDVLIKEEPVYRPQRLYTPERLRQLAPPKRLSVVESDTRTPTKSPLLLESTSRKRQRKTVAPRRIPQSAPQAHNGS